MKQNRVLDCDVLLFDLDGVLIDSTPCIIRHWREWSTAHGLDLDTVLASAHGVRTIETMRTVAPHLDVAAEAERFTAHEVADTEGVTAIPGADALLSSLPPDAWAIVTSAGRALAEARLRQAFLPVPRILVSADEVARGKPAPEPYLTGARRAGCPADRCVVLEDAPSGVTAGRSAGIRVVGIAATHDRKVLLEAGATIVTDRLSRLCIMEGEADFRLAIEVKAV
ncbi:MAG: HAD family hydrolase [Desulfosarcinaceae bacterium]|jgi:sugar-phosphatase